MKLVIKILLASVLIVLGFLVYKSDNGVKDTVHVSAKNGGTLFLNGISQQIPEFCFKPELDTDYNLALVSRNGRQNVDIKFNGNLLIGSPDGEDLGLKVKGVSSEKARDICDF